jgi:hypothetical protein
VAADWAATVPEVALAMAMALAAAWDLGLGQAYQTVSQKTPHAQRRISIDYQTYCSHLP